MSFINHILYLGYLCKKKGVVITELGAAFKLLTAYLIL